MKRYKDATSGYVGEGKRGKTRAPNCQFGLANRWHFLNRKRNGLKQRCHTKPAYISMAICWICRGMQIFRFFQESCLWSNWSWVNFLMSWYAGLLIGQIKLCWHCSFTLGSDHISIQFENIQNSGGFNMLFLILNLKLTYWYSHSLKQANTSIKPLNRVAPENAFKKCAQSIP